LIKKLPQQDSPRLNNSIHWYIFYSHTRKHSKTNNIAIQTQQIQTFSRHWQSQLSRNLFIALIKTNHQKLNSAKHWTNDNEGAQNHKNSQTKTLKEKLSRAKALIGVRACRSHLKAKGLKFSVNRNLKLT